MLPQKFYYVWTMEIILTPKHSCLCVINASSLTSRGYIPKSSARAAFELWLSKEADVPTCMRLQIFYLNWEVSKLLT